MKLSTYKLLDFLTLYAPYTATSCRTQARKGVAPGHNLVAEELPRIP